MKYCWSTNYLYYTLVHSKVFKCVLKCIHFESNESVSEKQTKKKNNSMPFVCKRTIPTERPPLVGEVSASFCEYRLLRGQHNEFPWPLISVFETGESVSESIQLMTGYGNSEGFSNTSAISIHYTTLQIILMWKM
jgi:hypothetical protein